jgi:hypothetical protein
VPSPRAPPALTTPAARHHARPAPLAPHPLLINSRLRSLRLPPSPLRRFKDFESEILEYHQLSDPYSLGASTGWTGLDQFYKWAPAAAAATHLRAALAVPCQTRSALGAAARYRASFPLPSACLSLQGRVLASHLD